MSSIMFTCQTEVLWRFCFTASKTGKCKIYHQLLDICRDMMKTVKKMYGTYMYERYLFAKEKDHFTRKLKRVNKQLEISGTFVIKVRCVSKLNYFYYKLNKAQRAYDDEVLDLKLRETFSVSNDNNVHRRLQFGALCCQWRHNPTRDKNTSCCHHKLSSVLTQLIFAVTSEHISN